MKDLDGLNTGNFDSLFVSGNTSMGGNLDVAWIITGTVTGGVTTGSNFTATDSSNQYRVNSTNFDLKSNTASPTFRLKNSSDVTSSSTLDVGTVTATTLNGSLVGGSVSGTTLNLSSTTNATSKSTGSLITAGGAGIAQDTYIGGIMYVRPSGSVGAELSYNGTTTNLYSFDRGLSQYKQLNLNDSLRIQAGTLQAYFIVTTESTSTSTGAVRIDGGVGIAKNLNVGGSTTLAALTTTGANTMSGITTISNATTSSSTTTGALVVTGGIGTQGNLNVGGTTTITGTLLPLGDVTIASGNPVAAGRSVTINNASTSSSAYSLLGLTNSAGGCYFFLNSTARSADGGINTATLRNDVGNLRLYCNSGAGWSISPSSAATTLPITTTSSLSVGTTLAVTGVATFTTTIVGSANLTVASTNDYSVSNGAIYTAGGIKADKSIFCATGFASLYGPILNLTGYTYNKVIENDYSKAGGLANDATYLYSAGSSSGSGSTYVIGYNTTQVKVNVSTASSSTTTGALVVTGGVGIGGNLYVGGTITGGSVVYASTSSGTFDVTNASGTTLTVQSTQASTSTTTGCATFAGGVGVAGNLYVGGTLSAGSVTYSTTSTGTMTITNSPGTTLDVQSTENSASLSTGAVKVAGGMGVAKSVYVGEEMVVGDTSISATRTFQVRNNSSNSIARARVYITSDTASGSIQVRSSTYATNPNAMIISTDNSAGIHIHNSSGQGLCVQSSITCELNLTSPVLTASTSLAVQNGTWTTNGNDIFINANSDGIYLRPTAGSLNSQIFSNGSLWQVYSPTGSVVTSVDKSTGLLTSTSMTAPGTTASTSSTTGTITTAGGLGISNATDAVSSTNGGSITTAGGLAVAKSAYIGTNLTVTGTLTAGTLSGSLNVSSGTITTLTSTTGNITSVVASTITSSSVTASTSVSTGGVILQGGLAIANTTDATSTTNGGSLTSAGGFAFNKSGYVGGSLTVSGTVTSGTVTTTTLNASGTSSLTTLNVSGTATIGTLSITNLTVPGTLTVSTMSATGTNYTTPAYTMDNTASASGTHTFFKSNVGTSNESALMVGTAVTTMNCAQLSFVNNASNALKEVKVGFYGQDVIKCRNGDGSNAGGLSLYGGPYFTYDEGTWTPTAVPSSNSVEITYNYRLGRYVRIGKCVTLTFNMNISYGLNTGVLYLLIQGVPSQLAMPSFTGGPDENTCQIFRGTWGGLTNPINATIWRNGFTLPSVYNMDGRTITIGAYTSDGNYITAAFVNTGASNQQLWGTLTYFLE